MKEKIALYPGSFDPFTIGHAHIVEKALKVFDKVVIYIGVNPNKTGNRMFEPRAVFEMLNNHYANSPRVHIVMGNKLSVDVAKEHGAETIIKGIRNTSDANDEITQALINKRIGGLETMLIPCDSEYSFISSSMVRSLLNSDRKKAQEFII